MKKILFTLLAAIILMGCAASDFSKVESPDENSSYDHNYQYHDFYETTQAGGLYISSIIYMDQYPMVSVYGMSNDDVSKPTFLKDAEVELYLWNTHENYPLTKGSDFCEPPTPYTTIDCLTPAYMDNEAVSLCVSHPVYGRLQKTVLVLPKLQLDGDETFISRDGDFYWEQTLYFEPYKNLFDLGMAEIRAKVYVGGEFAYALNKQYCGTELYPFQRDFTLTFEHRTPQLPADQSLDSVQYMVTLYSKDYIRYKESIERFEQEIPGSSEAQPIYSNVGDHGGIFSIITRDHFTIIPDSIEQ